VIFESVEVFGIIDDLEDAEEVEDFAKKEAANV